MKKLIAILLSLSMILALAACGAEPDATEPPTQAPTQAPTDPPTEPTEAPTTPAPVGIPEVVGTRFEAEDATMEGEFNPFGSGSDDGREENEGSSGGAHVGYFSTAGNTITWNINADADAAVTLVFRMASCNNNQDLALDGHVTVTVNGTALDLTGKVVAGDHSEGETNYTYFQEVTFENVSLTAGENTIVMECVGVGEGMENFNVDYVEVIGVGASVGTGEGGEQTSELPEFPTGEGVATGTQNVIVLGEEWGSVVAKTVVTLDVTVSASTITPESFLVYEVKEAVDMAASSGGEPSEEPVTATSTREVLAAYACDAEGNPVEGDSNMICLELYYDANVGGSFLYDFVGGTNTWLDPYELHLYTTDAAALTTADGKAITGLNVVPAIDLKAAMMPQLKGVDLSGTYSNDAGDITLKYGSYAPAEDDHTNALVIWLHGAGEGGANGEVGPEVANLGNEVTALYTEEFQSLFGGAYILTPQTPTMWMNNGTGEYTSDGSSIYTEALMALIDAYVKANPDIDTNRIIIGGCSNGGFMTMKMIMTYPEYFAAAYPICEAYTDTWITDDMINSIADLPLWFVYALNDTVVDPNANAIATINRLKAVNDDVHVSEFENVYGETYMGHWSWLYFFNNECVDENGTNMWQWLAQQTK